MWSFNQKYRPRAYNTRRASANAGTKRRGAKGKALSNRQRAQIRLMLKNQGELKHLSGNTSANTDVLSTGTLTSVSQVIQGDGESQRIGDQLAPMSFQYKGHYYLGTSSITNFVYQMRFIVFRWLPDTDDDVPSLPDIFEDSDVLSLYVADDLKRAKFNVLCDTGPLTIGPTETAAQAATSAPHINRVVQKTLKLTGKGIKFGPAGTTGKGHIYMLKISNSSTGHIVHKDYFRFSYKDQL